MRDLIEQEKFELEVLNELKSARILDHLIFGGGTMLRLCFGLNRYSIDLDFWLTERTNTGTLFENIEKCLSSAYKITDSADKFNTLIFEIKSQRYPRKLKIEIRKELKNITIMPAIAYSPSDNLQVYVKVVSLQDMMTSKIAAFLDRREIRDVFDIEFLLKKGVSLQASREDMIKIKTGLEGLSNFDYKVKLGSLLEEKDRVYYNNNNFRILLSAIEKV